jgi:hypothetical protein
MAQALLYALVQKKIRDHSYSAWGPIGKGREGGLAKGEGGKRNMALLFFLTRVYQESDYFRRVTNERVLEY